VISRRGQRREKVPMNYVRNLYRKPTQVDEASSLR
jgi:hypothetical protein